MIDDLLTLKHAVDNGGELDLAFPNGAHVWLWCYRPSASPVYLVRVQNWKHARSYLVDEWTEFAPAFAAYIAEVRRLSEAAA